MTEPDRGDGQLDYYEQRRPELMKHIPPTAQRVLDIGCGAGVVGAALKKRGIPYVAGIELQPEVCQRAAETLDAVIQGDVATVALPFEPGSFDCILFADVLEHLYDPRGVLERLKPYLAPEGLMVMSIPNIRYHMVFEMLGQGRWRYEESGILDYTHIRFFTAFEMRNLVRGAGLQLVKMKPLSLLSPDLKPRNPDGSITMRNVTVTPKNDADYVDLLTLQYLVIAGLK